MIKKQIAFVAAVAVLTFSGCGDDRSHPKDGNGNSVNPLKPVAEIVIDKNATTGYTEFEDDDNNSETLAFRWFGASDQLVFDGAKSRDLDSIGSGTLTYDWFVKNEDNETMSDSCINKTTAGSTLVIKICNDANDLEQEKFSVTLTVKDDENQTSSTKNTITIY